MGRYCTHRSGWDAPPLSCSFLRGWYCSVLSILYICNTHHITMILYRHGVLPNI
jgi:hypothetical protein